MAYATAAEMRDFMGEALLAQFTRDSGTTVDDTRLGTVIDKASSLMDGYLGSRYIIPITGTKSLGVLRPHCLEIAKIILLGRRLGNRFDTQAGDVSLGVEAFAWLKRVAERKASLPDAPEVTTPGISGGNATAGSDVPVFGDPNTTGSGGALL